MAAIRSKHEWWTQNRDKAPHLFRDELTAVVARLRDGGTQGAQLYTIHGGSKIWRMLMPKTKVHVYFRIDASKDDVEVITVWNAISGGGPDLSPF